jgi:carbon-monoxide dehydrogenase small subunit
VLLDGEAVKSCLVFAAQADGHQVQTVECLAGTDGLSPIQERFKEAHGLQCGFCTPGMLMTVTALAHERRRLTREEIREEIAGVLCRCTGYEFIVSAVEAHLASEGLLEVPPTLGEFLHE